MFGNTVAIQAQPRVYGQIFIDGPTILDERPELAERPVE